ncbi:Uncharacterised protein [Leminorella grimontii]|nr:Uncharacterised protein [Leminorella grimontii]
MVLNNANVGKNYMGNKKSPFDENTHSLFYINARNTIYISRY